MEARTRSRTCLVIVLAAGEGTRMYSARPKVLHAVAGRSLLAHVLDAVAKSSVTATAVVIGPGQDEVAAEAERVLPSAAIFIQRERRGTAHAVLAAKSAIERGADDILIVYGDTPLIRPATLSRLRAPLAARRRACGLRLSARRSVGLRPSRLCRARSLSPSARRPMRAQANARSRCATAGSWRLPATARLPSWSGSATTIVNANSI